MPPNCTSDTKRSSESAPPALALGPLVALQVGRVASYLTRGVQREGAEASHNTSSVFRSRGLLPPRLLQAFGASQSTHVRAAQSPEAEALCFAACLFPQRAFQLGDTELGLRVESFRKILPALAHAEPLTAETFSGGVWVAVFDSVFAGCESECADAQERLALLADISGAGIFPEGGSQGSDAATETNARLNGAALYLATCYPAMLARTLGPWRLESRFVRYFRRYLTTSPTSFCHFFEDGGARVDWARVRERLRQIFPGEPEECHALGVVLEQMAWKEARRWLHAGAVAERVRDFWESQWDKLTSGFPFYAFRSRFTWWWRQCLETYPFSRPEGAWARAELDETVGAQTAPTEDAASDEEALTPELLRVFHEGYRLVRTTFFRRADKKEADARHAAPYAANERLRRALDAIWYERLRQKIGAELPPALIKEIGARFPELGPDTINNLSHRLRMRLWAYALARLGRRRNSQILSTRRPSSGAGQEVDNHPLAGQPGVLTIASLARITPADQTLLGAFTAHIFLRPRVEPQRPDAWDFARYLRELWRWLGDETFAEAARTGAERGSRGDAVLTSAFQQTPFAELLRALTELSDERELEQYTETEFSAEAAYALELVAEVLSDPELSLCGDASLRAWRRVLGAEGIHWFVPVWYLTLVERLDEQEVIARLQVDEPEAAAVSRLVRAMRDALAAPHETRATQDAQVHGSEIRR